MSVRYLIERKYDFAPILLSNGSKIAINISETGNSCKVMLDPTTAQNQNHPPFEVIEAKYPNFIKISKENQMQTPFMANHEENQVLKRRHYFDNTTDKAVGPMIRYSDKKYAPDACWELKAKSHSVQELSDKFEIFKDSPTQSLFKSSTRLMDRKLTFLLSGKQNIKGYLQNGFKRKSPRMDQPFRSQPIGVNFSDNSANKKGISHFKSLSQRIIESLSKRRLNGGSASTFSSTICVPFINQRLCNSSNNVSKAENLLANGKLKNTEETVSKNFGSSKSMESLFVLSQQETSVGTPRDNEELKSVNQSLTQDVRKVNNFHENIVAIKSLLRPVDSKEFRYSYRVKKTPNNQFNKKIMFFENLSNSMTEIEYDHCSLA